MAGWACTAPFSNLFPCLQPTLAPHPSTPASHTPALRSRSSTAVSVWPAGQARECFHWRKAEGIKGSLAEKSPDGATAASSRHSTASECNATALPWQVVGHHRPQQPRPQPHRALTLTVLGCHHQRVAAVPNLGVHLEACIADSSMGGRPHTLEAIRGCSSGNSRKGAV